jgi:hypothetical protein
VTRVKLVWFVPAEALEVTRDAVFNAGAGRIGDYERCSWYTAGTGTFLGDEGTEPAVGESGREEHVPELRVETVVPAHLLEDVVAALAARIPTRSPHTTCTHWSTVMKAKLFTDGGSRGNPGPAAYGFVLEAEDGTVLDARGEGSALRRTTWPNTRPWSPDSSARSRRVSTSSRSSPTRSSSSSRCAASTA